MVAGDLAVTGKTSATGGLNIGSSAGTAAPSGGVNGDVYFQIGDESLKTTLLNLFYPVGSIYMNYSNSANPGTYLGGTWVAINNVFLLAAGNSYAGGSEGGSTTHTHGHGNYKAAIGATGSDSSAIGYVASNISSDSDAPTATSAYTIRGTVTSGTRSFNHYTPVYGTSSSGGALPPYRAVYVWRRTA